MATATKPCPPTAKVSDVIQNFAPTRRFGSGSGSRPYNVTSLDFDDTGELCLVAQDDDTLQIYNCKEGKHAKELKSQKYGVDIARFAHHPQSIIYASTKGDDAIRYLSTHDNTYTRYFRGHTAAVTSITLSPSDDSFLSSSLDNTVRLWDLRSSQPQGLLHLHQPTLSTYDPTATVIAIASPAAQSILLYDARNYDKAPFATFDLRPLEDAMRGGMDIAAPDWTTLAFSNDGAKLLVGTAGAGHYILDAFDGKLTGYCARPPQPQVPQQATSFAPRYPPAQYATLRQRQAAAGKNAATVATSSQGDVCLSPDGRYVISGSGSGSSSNATSSATGGGTGGGVHIYDTASCEPGDPGPEKILKPIANLMNGQEGEVRDAVGRASVVGYSPRHNLMVTAERGVVFWLPEVD